MLSYTKAIFGAGTLGLFLLANACGSSGASGDAPSGGVGGSSQQSGSGGSGSGSGGGLNLAGNGGANGTTTGTGGASECSPTLKVTIRDFRGANDDKGNKRHPDFENDAFSYTDDKNIVKPELGPDRKPVYNGNPTTAATSGKESFEQWYHDVKDVNQTFASTITLEKGKNGTYFYDNQEFFPIDGKGFKNDISKHPEHNYSFTLELHTQFEYKGGEKFTFRGDDDVFVFINNKLAINLGGVHEPQTETIDLDAKAQELGIAKGKSYTLDFFFAERHTDKSTFRLETTIGCFKEAPSAK